MRTCLDRTRAVAVFFAVVLVFAIAAPAGWSGESIALPPPTKSVGMDIFAALANRQSTRLFDKSKPIDAQIISNLLWAGIGVNRDDGKRTAPFTYNAIVLDLYVATPDGCFLYDAESHALNRVSSTDIRNHMYMQDEFFDVPLSIIVAFDADRLPMAYDYQLEYESAWDSAGAVSQNIALAAAGLKLGTVVVVSLHHEEIGDALGLGEKEKIFLSMPVGFLR